MSRNEFISGIDTTTPYTLDDFTPIPTELTVNNAGIMTKVDSTGASVQLGPMQLAAATYVIGAGIDVDGKAVVHLSNGTSITFSKVTATRTVPVTLNGTGQYSSTNGATLEFTPITANYPLTLVNNNIEYLQTNSLKLSQYTRLEHRGPEASGRYFTSWTALPLKVSVNNLGLTLNNSIITLPAGRYYIKLYGNTHMGDYTYLALIDSTTNQPIHDPKIAYTSRTSASGIVFGSQELVVPATTTVYFGHRTDVQVATHGDGLGVYMPFQVDILYDIYNVLEIWRIDE